MNNYQPSLLVANIFDPVSKNESTIMELYEAIADLKFYTSLETRIIHDPAVNRAFSELSLKNTWSITYWLTSNLNAAKLSLGDTDPEIRKSAVEYTKSLIELAIHGNASYIGICSGKHRRDIEAEYQSFKQSIQELLEFTADVPAELLIEPLDGFADKRFILGNETMVTRLFCDLQEYYAPNKLPLLCIDTAHIALNRDPIVPYMQHLGKYSNRIHFANAVLDRTHPDYGDKHLPFNHGGFLNEAEIKALFTASQSISFKTPEVYLTCEIRSLAEAEMWPTEASCQSLLRELLKSKI